MTLEKALSLGRQIAEMMNRPVCIGKDSRYPTGQNYFILMQEYWNLTSGGWKVFNSCVATIDKDEFGAWREGGIDDGEEEDLPEGIEYFKKDDN